MDVRSKKMEPFAQSEYQEDELLSATTIKGCALIPTNFFCEPALADMILVVQK
jgi:hypothetical protein